MKPKNQFYLKIALILVIVSASFASAQAKTITVCPSGCDYTRIQSAINVANIGDIIEVQSGVYYENVNVNKQIILRGIGKPVVDAGGSGSAITLNADGITLEGFEVRNSGISGPNSGIKVTSNNNVIKNNTASNNNRGIELYQSSYNTLTNNNAYSNKNYGIYLYSSSNNTLKNNSMFNNSYNFGVYGNYFQNIAKTNKVNGKMAYIWIIPAITLSHTTTQRTTMMASIFIIPATTPYLTTMPLTTEMASICGILATTLYTSIIS